MMKLRKFVALKCRVSIDIYSLFLAHQTIVLNMVYSVRFHPKLLPCHAHCSTGVMIAQQWYACFVKVDAKKKTEINASLTSSFVATGASGFSLL